MKTKIIILAMATLALFSCQDDKTVQNLNEKQESNNNGSKNNEASFVEGKIYRYYTISDKPEFAYMTSILLENETLKISENKIKTTDIPEGINSEPQLTINKIPVEDIYYNGKWVELSTAHYSICQIPVGFSDGTSKAKPSFPSILSQSNNQKIKHYCACFEDVGQCNISAMWGGGDITTYRCDKISCSVCKLHADKTGKAQKIEIPYGVIYVKANKFEIVDKL